MVDNSPSWWLSGLYAILIALAVTCVLCIIAVLATMRVNNTTSTPAASASVYIDNSANSCSATHIGAGQFISSSHCTKAGGPLTIQTDKGATANAEILWANKLYDLALLHADGLELKRAEINCSLIPAGAEVTANGNPMGILFVRTRGTVLSSLQPGDLNVHGHGAVLRDRIVLDITVAPGSSGGGVFDANDRLVGVVSAIIQGLRYAFIVPSPTVCRMLGR